MVWIPTLIANGRWLRRIPLHATAVGTLLMFFIRSQYCESSRFANIDASLVNAGTELVCCTALERQPFAWKLLGGRGGGRHSKSGFREIRRRPARNDLQKKIPNLLIS